MPTKKYDRYGRPVAAGKVQQSQDAFYGRPAPKGGYEAVSSGDGGDKEPIDFESWGNAAGSITAALTDKSKYKGASTGKAIGTTIGSAADLVVPGLGRVLGPILGTVGGVIGGASDKDKYERDFNNMQSRKFGRLNMMHNNNPYGTDEVMYAEDGGVVPQAKSGIHIAPSKRGTFTAAAKRHGKSVQGFASQVLANKSKYSPAMVKKANFARNAAKWRKEEGGMIEEEESMMDPAMSQLLTDMTPQMEEGGMMEESGEQGEREEPELQMVNIEKGEILVDPVTFEVLREYSNPNRYKPHAKDPLNEPVGNFTFIEPGKVVIPKKYAERFKKGDKLTAGSIILEILKDQRNNPQPVVKAPGAEDIPKAQSGYMTGEDPKKPYRGMGSVKPVDPMGLGPGDEGYYYPMDLLDPKSLAPEASYARKRGLPILDNIGISTNQLSGPNKTNPGGNPTLEFGNHVPGTGPTYAAQGASLGTDESVSSNKKGINMVNAARAVNAIPTALGIGFAMEHDPYLKYDEPNLNEAESYLQAIPVNPTIEASRRAIHGSRRAVNQMLNNIVGPGTRAEVAANQAASIDAEGKLIQDATNSVMEARGRKLAGLADFSAKKETGRYNARAAFTEALRKDRAARQNLIHAGASEFSRNFAQSVMDDEQINAINTMFEFMRINPGEKVPIEDLGLFGKYIYDQFLQSKASSRLVKTTPKAKSTANGQSV